MPHLAEKFEDYAGTIIRNKGFFQQLYSHL